MVGKLTGMSHARCQKSRLICSRALVKRHSIFRNANGVHDWNEELAAPLQDTMAPTWVDFFTHVTPAILNKLVDALQSALENFHRAIKNGAAHNLYGAPAMARLAQLDRQVATYQALFRSHGDTIAATIDKEQKVANRLFVPIIEEHLTSAYEWCSAQKGL